jgi:hypothetical protein
VARSRFAAILRSLLPGKSDNDPNERSRAEETTKPVDPTYRLSTRPRSETECEYHATNLMRSAIE